MTKKSVTINLENGLDARPIALLVQRASQHDSSIYIETGDKRVNAKSIMGMMSLVLDNGATLTVSADGNDEAEAVVDLENFLTGATA